MRRRLVGCAVRLRRLPSCCCCCSCGGLCLLRRAEAGSRPAASHFLLLRQKKLTKEKATRVPEALRAPLRYSVLRGLPKLASLRQRQPLSAKPPFLALAHTGGSGTGSTTASQGVGPLLRSASNEGAAAESRGKGSGVGRWSGSALSGRPSAAKARCRAAGFIRPPRVRESEERRENGSGLALFERSEFSQTPFSRVPQRCPKGLAHPGRLFFR